MQNKWQGNSWTCSIGMYKLTYAPKHSVVPKNKCLQLIHRYITPHILHSGYNLFPIIHTPPGERGIILLLSFIVIVIQIIDRHQFYIIYPNLIEVRSVAWNIFKYQPKSHWIYNRLQQTTLFFTKWDILDLIQIRLKCI